MLVACDLFSSSIKFQRINDIAFKKIKKKIKNIQIIKIVPERTNNLDLKNVEIYWGNRITSDLIEKMPNLKWIHYGSTGISKKIYKPVFKKKIKVTNTQKTFSSAVSGTVLSFIFSLARGVHYCNFLKNEKKLNRFNFDKISEDIQDVYGQNILIVGLGEIGLKIAKTCNALEMNVSSVKKNIKKIPSFIRKNYKLNNLKKAVKDKDFIVSLLPLTDKTRKIFDKKIFSTMKKNSIFINVGRGGTVNENDLLNALKTKKILGAGLDVVTNEPIKSDSPLLRLKNVLITPHIAGVTNKYWDDQILLFSKNLMRYKNNQKLKNLKNYTSIREGY
jgi:phosphoglycerate dehydrogenase-like enzyme